MADKKFDSLTATREEHDAAILALDNPPRVEVKPFVCLKDPLDVSSSPAELLLEKARFKQHYRGY